MNNLKFATFRLGKTSIQDIQALDQKKPGVVEDGYSFVVTCTQVPDELVEDTIVFIWLGSDNSKGMPTAWKQGFRGVGVVTAIDKAAKYNDESHTTIALKYVFEQSINRLDILRESPAAYYWCSALPIVGLDYHSNQTVRILSEAGDRSKVGAFLYALNSVQKTFRKDIVSIFPSVQDSFWDDVADPKLGDAAGTKGVLGPGALIPQLFTYGAPGTGKSHKIDECTNEKNSIRVTFHPDTDYAAFVGAYKPTMESTDKGLLTLQELGTVLQSLKDRGETRPEQKLGAEFWRSFEKLTPADVKSILENDSMYAEVMKGVAVGEYLTRIENGGKQIVYSFVPQAFMKAYVEAWRRYTNDELQGDAKTYYLVIEEINRGNCAQIFGDLFQLLDRADNGFSAYAITPDDDIQKFLEKDKDYKLADIPFTEDIKKTTEDGSEKVIATVEDVKTGKKLVLPPNLCIWATMNTSDQSLFPIDSAFKRRWEWEYVPIEDAGKGWQIDVGGVKYIWWSFLEKINDVIATETSSEDKQLGYFFVKAKDKVIDAKTFVSKVIFYLWGDVFKDNLPEGEAFQYAFKKDGKDDKRPIRFADFYHPETGNTKDQWRDKLLTSFLDALAVEKDTSAPNASGTPDASGQGSANADGGVAEAGE